MGFSYILVSQIPERFVFDEQSKAEIGARFKSAANDPRIVAARRAVLGLAGPALHATGSRLHVLGYTLRDDDALASGFLCYIGAELAAGMDDHFAQSRAYAAAALLRQLIEVEYLALLAYVDPTRVAKWYRSPNDTIREEFTPAKMRKAECVPRLVEKQMMPVVMRLMPRRSA